jgi:hypothetical protein
MVNEAAVSADVLLICSAEYQEPVVARLLTVME